MVFSGRVLTYEVFELNRVEQRESNELRLRALKVRYEEAISKIMNQDIVDQISIYSAGIARWDGLIAALTNYQSATYDAEQAADYILGTL